MSISVHNSNGYHAITTSEGERKKRKQMRWIGDWNRHYICHLLILGQSTTHHHANERFWKWDVLKHTAKTWKNNNINIKLQHIVQSFDSDFISNDTYIKCQRKLANIHSICWHRIIPPSYSYFSRVLFSFLFVWRK